VISNTKTLYDISKQNLKEEERGGDKEKDNNIRTKRNGNVPSNNHTLVDMLRAHHRFLHYNEQKLRRLSNAVSNLKLKGHLPTEPCASCMLGKMRRQHIQRGAHVLRTELPRSIIFLDFLGRKERSVGGKQYCLIALDAFTGMIFASFTATRHSREVVVAVEDIRKQLGHHFSLPPLQVYVLEY
jgi:ribosomal protein S19